MKNDVLMLINKDKVEVPIVPSHLTNKICELYHDSFSAGLMGYEKTFISIQKKFYWPMMKLEIYDFGVIIRGGITSPRRM